MEERRHQRRHQQRHQRRRQRRPDGRGAVKARRGLRGKVIGDGGSSPQRSLSIIVDPQQRQWRRRRARPQVAVP
uniref:Uncharacterized protein n=1 Tax=Globodera pallida TaxID=36090 RepID=A0A183CQC1_GLOPA